MTIKISQRNLVLIFIAITLSFIAAMIFFVSSFLFSESQSIADTSFFHLLYQVGMLSTTILSARKAKSGPAASLLRASIYLHALYFALLVYFLNSETIYISLLGFVAGMAAGCFWLSYNVLVFRVVKASERQKYFGLVHIVAKAVTVIVPPIYGWLAWKYGYYALFSCVFVTAFLAVFLTSLVKDEETKNEDAYEILKFLNIIKKYKNFKYLFLSFFFCGFSFTGVLFILIPLVIFRAESNELILGFAVAAMPLFEAISAYFSRKIKHANYNKYLYLSTFLILIATVISLQSFSLFSTISFSIIYALCVPVLLILNVLYSFNILEQYSETSSKMVEYMTLRELTYLAGRIIAWLIVIFTLRYYGESDQILLYLFILCSVAILFHTFFLSKVELKESHEN